MVEHLQDLQLSVLVALILEHLFDSDSLASFCDCGLENDAKGPISNDLLSVISEALNSLLAFAGVLVVGA